jgi:predicted TIM-barrel fold metal-dependent hydrolase
MTVPARVGLSDLAVVDGHCHPLLADPWAVSADSFLDLLSEGRPGTMTAHIPHTGYYRRTLNDLAQQLTCEPKAGAILERRQVLGPEAAARLLSERKVTTLVVDTGYPPGAMPLEEMRCLLPCQVHEVFRIEACAEALLPKGLPYPEFREAFMQELRSAARHCVALKTIIAYRSGLAVRSWEREDAAQAYQSALSRVRAGGAPRLTEKPLLDTLLLSALEVAREGDLPFQFHTGFGDPDIDLPHANPLLLRPLLEDPAWAGVRIVLLHMAYPYFREASFMVAVWPQVFLDLSLALPFLGPGAIPPLIEILSLAPTSKLLYGSDLGGLPELLALSADWGRGALGEALGWLVERGSLTADEARAAGRMILSENATALYRLSHSG